MTFRVAFSTFKLFSYSSDRKGGGRKKYKEINRQKHIEVDKPPYKPGRKRKRASYLAVMTMPLD